MSARQKRRPASIHINALPQIAQPARLEPPDGTEQAALRGSLVQRPADTSRQRPKEDAGVVEQLYIEIAPQEDRHDGEPERKGRTLPRPAPRSARVRDRQPMGRWLGPRP